VTDDTEFENADVTVEFEDLYNACTDELEAEQVLKDYYKD